MDFDLKNPADFAKEFLNKYCANGLGSLSKRDADVLVFHLLVQDGMYNLPEDMFKACRELKLTETKVRNLYQESQLKHEQYDEATAREKFVELISKSAIEHKGGRFILAVRDPLLKQYFEEWVASVGGFSDTSFNKNIVSINKTIFERLLDKMCEQTVEDLKAHLPEELDILKEAEDKKALFRMFIEELTKSAGKEAGSLSIKALAQGLKMLITQSMA